jgi:hypothetical protein
MEGNLNFWTSATKGAAVENPIHRTAVNDILFMGSSDPKK